MIVGLRSIVAAGLGLLCSGAGPLRAEPAAQTLTGFTVGANISRLSGRASEDAAGLRMGLTIRSRADRRIGFESGLLYDVKGAKQGGERLALHYITVPAAIEVFATQRGPIRPYLKAGMEAGILATARIGGLQAESMHTYDASLAGGVGFDVPMGSSMGSIEIGISRGLRNIRSASTRPGGGGDPPLHAMSGKNRTIMVTAGVRHAQTSSPGIYADPVRPSTGIELGLTAATVSAGYRLGTPPRKPGWRTGGHIGIQLEIPQGKVVSIETGLAFERKGASWDSGGEKKSLKLDYISVPLAIRGRIRSNDPRRVRPYVKFGPELSLLVRSEIASGTAGASYRNLEHTGGIDLNVAVGAGVDIPRHGRVGFLEVALAQGLTNTYTWHDLCEGCTHVDDSRNRVIRMGIGIRR
jgi:hypothetical protein